MRTRANIWRDTRGATSVEFGMLALPLTALIGAVIQTAFTIWAAQNLDANLIRTVRTIYTGSFQTDNSGVTDTTTLLNTLRTRMCGGTTTIPMVFDCQSVKLDVQVGTSFASSGAATPFNTTTKTWNSNAGKSYACADPGTIVIVTAAVKLPVFFSVLNPTIQTFGDGSHLLQSTVVFRTEPYPTTPTTGCGS